MERNDLGELNFRVKAEPKERMVVMEFGEQVAWIGLHPEEARTLAHLLATCANELDCQKGAVN